MSEDPGITPLYHWSLYLWKAGCRVNGALVDSEDIKTKRVFTSRVVSRDGMVITTLSGSKYRLMNPCFLCSTAHRRIESYKLLKLKEDHTIEEFIDACIQSDPSASHDAKATTQSSPNLLD